MENKAYIFDLHADHVEWLNSLAFFQDDLNILKERLSEVSSKNTMQEVKMGIEKFQNQFIIQQNEIDKLKHDINAAEHNLAEEIKNNPTASDHRKVTDDESLRDRAETFVSLFKEMKSEFSEFVSENL